MLFLKFHEAYRKRRCRKIFEYGGTGVKDLNVLVRAAITNMGAELGATNTTEFPSAGGQIDLKAVGRETDWVELRADDDAEYSEIIDIDLGAIEPMIAQPHSLDNVVTVRSLKGTALDQICIGSCTNSSYQGLKAAATILKGKLFQRA